jgi:hypothetical protein
MMVHATVWRVRLQDPAALGRSGAPGSRPETDDLMAATD